LPAWRPAILNAALKAALLRMRVSAGVLAGIEYRRLPAGDG
jgi:hypothetical protein